MSEELSIATLLKLAVSKDKDVRADADQQLASRGSSLGEPQIASALPVLIAALTSRDELVARNAARWLIAIGAPAVPALQEALRTASDAQVQHKILTVLAQLGPMVRPLLPEIRVLLKSSEHHVCSAAARALLAVGPPAAEAANDLLLALDHRDPDVKANVVRTLAMLGVDAAIREPTILSKLIELLAHESDGVRQAASEAVAAMGEMAVPWIVSLIEQKDERRAAHVTAESLLTNQEVAGADPEHLTADDLRNWSWRVWHRLRSSPEPLLQAAVHALSRLAVQRDDVLNALGLAARDRNPAIQKQAIKALGARGTRARSQIPVLVELLADAELSLHALILTSLDQIASDWPRATDLDQTPHKLIKRLASTASRETASATLVRLGESAVPALVDALRDGDRVVREACAAILQRIGPPAQAAVPALEAVAANETENGFVREAARRALAAIGAGQTPS